MTRPLAAALIVLAMFAPNSAPAQDKRTTVVIQDYPGTGNMLYRVAAAKGFCEKHGLVCKLQTIPSAPLGMQGLLAKSIDAAAVPTEVLINAMVKGANVKAIASGAQTNVFEIVTRQDLAIPNAAKGYPAFMADLKGKKIGVPARGSAAELQFGLLALRANLKPEDFTFVAVGAPNTSYGALRSGQIDASMTFGISASICDVLKTCRTIYRASDAEEPKEIAGTNGACAVIAVRQEMIDKAPEVADALIAAGKDAESFIQDPMNFDELLRIAKSYFQLDLPQGDEIVAATLKHTVPAFKAGISRQALKQIADNMFETHQIDAPFDTSNLLYAKAP